ncbi:MAG: 4,5-DOPA dioxygenase extradiol [Eubacteriales bacterium]|nr:4,5-DOPA dioxygenase extradiol [Eubacteriales bacterium]
MSLMPVLFVGHGSPMNAIEDNTFSERWKQLGARLPKPEAILSVSAHWFTNGTKVTDTPAPKMIYDMYGFPEALYRVTYPAPGSPRFARLAKNLIGSGVEIDNTWGLDHGSWSVLRRLYPDADAPVFQLSVDAQASMKEHFEIGRKLRSLREQGVLIFGSGNVVHNLARVDWNMDGGFPWADTFDGYIRENVLHRNFKNVVGYEQAGSSASLAFTTPDHFAPLLYVLGASDERDRISVFNEARMMGSLSMTSYLFEQTSAD